MKAKFTLEKTVHWIVSEYPEFLNSYEILDVATYINRTDDDLFPMDLQI